MTFLWPQFYFVFLLVYGRTILVWQFILSIYPSSFSILILCFFTKQLFCFWILKKKIWLDRRKKYFLTWHFHSIIIFLPFSQYNHIQNVEEKKLFQHFNLIKIKSTRLLPILDLIIPPLPEGGGGYTVLPLFVRPSKIFFVTFFSATIDGRNLIFGHKLHIGMPYRGKRFWNHQIPTSCLPT